MCKDYKPGDCSARGTGCDGCGNNDDSQEMRNVRALNRAFDSILGTMMDALEAQSAPWANFKHDEGGDE